MVTVKLPNSDLAAKIRGLAQYLESTQRDVYSCNLLSFRIGYMVGRTHADVFGLDGENESDLWAMHPEMRNDMRVLLLCFAAAMADTGDFE